MLILLRGLEYVVLLLPCNFVLYLDLKVLDQKIVGGKRRQWHERLCSMVEYNWVLWVIRLVPRGECG